VDKLQVEAGPLLSQQSFKPRRLLFQGSVSGRKTPSYDISFQFCLSCKLSSLNPELRIVQSRIQLSVIGHKPELHPHRLDEVLHALNYKALSTHRILTCIHYLFQYYCTTTLRAPKPRHVLGIYRPIEDSLYLRESRFATDRFQFVCSTLIRDFCLG
jgi:hypothetical protein